MRTFFIIFILIIAALCIGYYFGYDIGFKRAVEMFGENEDGKALNETDARDIKNLIQITSPKEGQIITSPFIVKGEARGTWYFEASFPLVLVDWDGRIIAQSHAQAQDDGSTGSPQGWMTENFVPFEGTIEFVNPYEKGAPDFMKRGALIFRKDNPSGLPQYDAAVEIPILFE